MSGVDDLIRAAARHLLEAARLDNDDPTASTLAAATALHQAGAYVSTVHVEHCASHCVRLLMGDLSKVELRARRLRLYPREGVIVAPSYSLDDRHYTDEDSLTAALRALLEPPGLEVEP